MLPAGCFLWHCAALFFDHFALDLSFNSARGGFVGSVPRGEVMKEAMKIVLIAAALSFVTTIGYTAEVKDWKDLEKVHKHIRESINEMERARAANHYDMQGHGAKAEQLLREAEKELHEAVEAAKKH
jgi:hypothetical protein